MDSLLAAIRGYRALYAAILAYAGLCALWASSLGAGAKFLPFMYVTRWLVLLVLIALVQLTVKGLRALRARRFWAEFRAELADWGSGFAAGSFLCIGLALLHGTYTSVKTIAPDFLAFRYDVLLADVDRALHGTDPWKLLTWMNPVTDLVQPLYSAGWLLLVVLVTTFVALSRTSARLKAQYAWTFTLCWVLLGNLLSSLMLAAGPAYYERLTGSGRFSGLMAHLAAHDGTFSARALQERLWSAYAEQSVGLASGISAFPSMHVSIVTLFTLYGFKVSKPLGFAFLAYAVLIMLGSVHLGWHYAVDGYVSILVTLAIWKAVAWGLQGFPLPSLNGGRRLAGETG